MKKKFLQIMICLSFTIVNVVTISGNDFDQPLRLRQQPLIEWEKTYGSNMVDWGCCVQQTPDGGFILTGAYHREVYTPCRGFVYIVKTDDLGNVDWEKQYGNAFKENVGQSIQPTSDGGYIIAGYTGYNYYFDAYILKIDSNGALLWARSFGLYEFYDNSMSVQETTDQGYIITGWTGSYDDTNGDAWLIKLNATGEDEWIQIFGGNDLDGADCVQQTSDDGFIITGTTHSFDSGGNGDVWLIKTDANGNEVWNKSYGGWYLDFGKCVQQTSDGGYIITGSTSSYGAGNSDVWLIKTDSDGNELWNATFGGSNWDEGKSVTQTADHGYFITGDHTDTDPVHRDSEVYMIKTDKNGSEEWNYIIDHNGVTDSGSYGIQTNDGGYIITGETGKYNLAAVDVLLIKIQGINSPPNPPTITGPTKGKIKIATTYNFTTTDLNSDVFYYIDWGDNTSSGWIGPYYSGEKITQSHTWSKKGDYTIKAKAKDTFGNESDWGELSVTMPCSYNIPFEQFWIKILRLFPHAFLLLCHLIGY